MSVKYIGNFSDKIIEINHDRGFWGTATSKVNEDWLNMVAKKAGVVLHEHKTYLITGEYRGYNDKFIFGKRFIGEYAQPRWNKQTKLLEIGGYFDTDSNVYYVTPKSYTSYVEVYQELVSDNEPSKDWRFIHYSWSSPIFDEASMSMYPVMKVVGKHCSWFKEIRERYAMTVIKELQTMVTENVTVDTLIPTFRFTHEDVVLWKVSGEFTVRGRLINESFSISYGHVKVNKYTCDEHGIYFTFLGKEYFFPIYDVIPYSQDTVVEWKYLGWKCVKEFHGYGETQYFRTIAPNGKIISEVSNIAKEPEKSTGGGLSYYSSYKEDRYGQDWD